jgi:hypothetical protein
MSPLTEVYDHSLKIEFHPDTRKDNSFPVRSNASFEISIISVSTLIISPLFEQAVL